MIYIAQTFKYYKMIDSKSFPKTSISQPPVFSPYRQQKLPLYVLTEILCAYINKYINIHPHSCLSFLKPMVKYYSHTYQRLLLD